MKGSNPHFTINKKATSAFILALVGILVTPVLLIALVLWFLARRDIHWDPNQRGFKLASIGVGFSLVVHVLMLALIVTLMLDYEPTGALRILHLVERTFFVGTQARNESEAIETMLSIRGALNKFYATNGGYPGSLDELVEAGLLEARLAQPEIGRYTFTYEVVPYDLVQGKRVFSRFLISAWPRPFFARTKIIMIETGLIGVYDPREEGLVDKEIPPPDDWTGPRSIKRKTDSDPLAEVLDLNTATAEQLEKLPGIGPTTAKAIVRFREKSGPLRRVEDLLAIRGITKKKLEKIRPLVTVKEPPKAETGGREEKP